MGHSTQAALLATLTVGSLRNSRRALAVPAEQADIANHVLASEARDDQFVTGQLLRIQPRWTAPPSSSTPVTLHPYLTARRASRQARRHHRTVPWASKPVRTPRKRSTFNPATGSCWSPTAISNAAPSTSTSNKRLEATADRHPRQIVQELASNVLDATGGKLRDDATAVCIDWYGPAGIRHATGGASRARATLT